jgi:Kef-type K+ transport system membrane component KefB
MGGNNMDSLAITLVIVFSAVVLLPLLAPRVRMPVITLELIFGIVIGRSLLDLVPAHAVIDFFSSFGLVYLMFLAGMDTDLARIRWVILKKVLAIALVSMAIPFISGVAISHWVKMNPLLLGTILCTTSLGLVLPMLKEISWSKRLSQMLLVSVVIVDILSMFLLAFVLATLQGTLEIRLLYSMLALVILFVIPWIVRRQKVRRKITNKLFRKKYFEMEMRVAFAIIFLLAALSVQLGFHSIIGAYIAGLLVSEILTKATLEQERLQSFGYSFFIPLFFIFTGAQVNLLPVLSTLNNLAILLAIITTGIVSKVIGVAIASKLSGLKTRHSIAFGLFHTARLSLIIAAADISLELGFIDSNLFAIFIVLAVVSATAAPSLGKHVLAKQN